MIRHPARYTPSPDGRPSGQTISLMSPLDALRGWLQADPEAFYAHVCSAVARGFARRRYRPGRSLADELAQVCVATVLDPYESERALRAVSRESAPSDAFHALDLLCFCNVDRQVQRMRRRSRLFPFDRLPRELILRMAQAPVTIGAELVAGGLSADDSATVAAYMDADCDQEQAADKLGITHGAMRMRLMRIRRRLRQDTEAG